MKTYLHVTSNNQYFGTVWTGYIVENGLAHPLAGFDHLSRAHGWALENGFDGYIIGAPSVPWVKTQPKHQRCVDGCCTHCTCWVCCKD